MKNLPISLALLVIGFSTMQSCKKNNTLNNNSNNSSSEQSVSTNFSIKSHNLGTNCMSCHKSGGNGEGWFTIAGSVYDSLLTSSYPNSTIQFYSGPNGTGTYRGSVKVDGLGNFYSTEKMDFGAGIYPSIQGGSSTNYMGFAITTGACNSCHGISTGKIWGK